jgi:hypothetical protein
MEGEMKVTWKLLVIPIIVLALRSVSCAQQNPENSGLDGLKLFWDNPEPTCRILQLQSQDGTPIRHAPVRLSVVKGEFKTPHLSQMTIEFKPVRKLKTDAEGKIHLPKLKRDTYRIELANAPESVFEMFNISDDWQPGECTQVFVAKDIKPVAAEDPAKKIDAPKK